jgi:peptide/nickel transport system substrate-binding protein
VIRGLATAAALVTAVTLSGCLGGDDTRGSGQEGGAAFVALGAVPSVRDPALANDAGSQTALWLVYTPPLTYRRAEGEQGTEVIPGVARDLPEVSGDGRTYTLRIRPRLRFSNGRPVRASDVRHSILRAARLGETGGRLFAGVSGIEANDRTGVVSIELARPDPSFPHALAAVQAGVVPAGTPMRDSSSTPPPGVGPYRIAAGRSPRRLDLVREPEFRLPGVPAGLIDLFQIRAGGSPAAQVDAVNAGQLDVMTDTPPEGLLPELRSELEDRYSEHPAMATRYLAVRAGRGPLETPELREALAYAIDKPEAARRLAGLVRPTCNLLPPNLPGYAEPDPCPWGDPDEHPDLVHAEELVEDAGAEGAVVTVASAPRDRPIARLYVETLTQVGLAARHVESARADIMLKVARTPLPDSARFLGPLARRVPLFVDPEALLLADELAATEDPDEAADLAEQLDHELVEAAVAIPYADDLRTLFLSPRIDSENCARVHPVYGIDLSSLCIR